MPVWRIIRSEGLKKRKVVLIVEARCYTCGIAEQAEDKNRWCYKYKFEITDVTAKEKSNCYYYIEPQYEDGEALTASQTLMIKECEVASRRMRGPV